MSDRSGWIKTISDKMQELRLIADWAACVNLGSVRDHCRLAISDLQHEFDRQQEMSK